MATIFTQNDNLETFWSENCQLEINHVIHQPTVKTQRTCRPPRELRGNLDYARSCEKTLLTQFFKESYKVFQIVTWYALKEQQVSQVCNKYNCFQKYPIIIFDPRVAGAVDQKYAGFVESEKL